MTETTQTALISLEEILTSNLEEIISSELELDCRALFLAYSNHVGKMDSEKEPVRWTAVRLVRDLCGMNFRPSDRAEPFGPMFVFDGGRSAIPSDFRGQQNEVPGAWAPMIKNPALRARIADIVWLNDRKRPECGRLAVEPYLECIEVLLTGQALLGGEDGKAWDVTAVELLKRALIIAYAMGRNKDEADRARAVV